MSQTTPPLRPLLETEVQILAAARSVLSSRADAWERAKQPDAADHHHDLARQIQSLLPPSGTGT